MSHAKTRLATTLLPLLYALPAGAQCETQRLLSPPSAPGGSFGFGVAMANDRLLVSDPQAATLCPDPFACGTGAVHAFDLVEGRWEFAQTIVPHDVQRGDSFGISIDLDDERLIVGAYDSSISGISAGGAFVYDFDGEAWVETARIAPPEPIGFAGFGSSVAIDGDFALVQQQDSVYTFRRSGADWEHIERLDPPDDPPDRVAFGLDMEIADGWAFIGASRDAAEVFLGGAVYVYRVQPDGRLRYVQKLVPPDVASEPEFGPLFGESIAFDGRSLVVGGRGADRDFENQGVVYVYELRDGSWQLIQELTHEPAGEGHAFGMTVSVAGDTIVAGAWNERTPTTLGVGYIFRRISTGAWVQVDRLLPDTPSSGFGVTGTDGRWAVIGAPGEPVGDRQPGAAHVFDLSCVLCLPDLDADGQLTIFDFLAFQNLFDAGDPIADFDGDGELTVFDFLAFQSAFDAGCE